MSKQHLKPLHRSNRVLVVGAIESRVIRQNFAGGHTRPVLVEPVRRLKMVQIRPEEKAFRRFRLFRPEFSTTAGYVKAGLHKIGFSKVNGEPVAYYLLRYYDSNAKAFVSNMYLYALRHGEPTMLQMLSHRKLP